MLLSSDQIDAFSSRYLASGIHDEEFRITEIDVRPGLAVGYVDALRYFTPGTGVFHLSAFVAMPLTSQIAINYGCWENGLERKQGEAFLREARIRCLRTITATSGIAFRLTFRPERKRLLPGNVAYYRDADVDIQNGAFVGTFSMFLPLGLTVMESTAGAAALAG